MTQPPQNRPESLEQILNDLRKNYIAAWPDKRKRMFSHLGNARNGQKAQDAVTGLRMEFHRIAGTGATYGFPEVTRLGRQAESYAERLIKGQEPISSEVLTKFEGFIVSLDQSFANGPEL